MIFRSMLAAQGSTVVTPPYTPAANTSRNTLGLNGSSEYATIAADASITFGDGTRSFVGWYEVTATTGTLFQHGLNSGASYVDIVIDGNNDISARAFSSAANFSVQRGYRSDDPLSQTGIHLVGVTYNTWGTFQIYVDGAEVASTSYATGNPGTLTATSEFQIGRRVNGTAFVNGSVGPVYLFDKNLSASEHAAVYNTGVGIQPADFSGHANPVIAGLYSNMMFGIPLNDGEANEETDGSSNTNNATLQGSPVYDGTTLNIED